MRKNAVFLFSGERQGEKRHFILFNVCWTSETRREADLSRSLTNIVQILCTLSRSGNKAAIHARCPQRPLLSTDFPGSNAPETQYPFANDTIPWIIFLVRHWWNPTFPFGNPILFHFTLHQKERSKICTKTTSQYNSIRQYNCFMLSFEVKKKKFS